MDDGYKFTTGFYLCTDSFSYKENEYLAKALDNNFNIKCGIHKITNGYRIYISKKKKYTFYWTNKSLYFKSFFIQNKTINLLFNIIYLSFFLS